MNALETQRLLIRPFTLADLEDAYQMLDVDIQWGGPEITKEERARRLQFQIDLANWGDAGRCYGQRALVLKSTGQMIGICALHPDFWSAKEKAIFWSALFPGFDPVEMPDTSLELGIGYALASACRRQGYAAEAVRAVLDFAFMQLKIHRVFAVTDRDNVDSIALMQRVGMRVAKNPDSSVVYPGAAGVIELSNFMKGT